MNDFYSNADWSPAEIHERERMAEDYSRRCYEARRAVYRRFGTFVQRLFFGSVLLFMWTFVLAVLLGAF